MLFALIHQGMPPLSSVMSGHAELSSEEEEEGDNEVFQPAASQVGAIAALPGHDVDSATDQLGKDETGGQREKR
jgi:hypothetical protein